MEHYYQPEIECAPYEEIRKIQSEKLVKQVLMPQWVNG